MSRIIIKENDKGDVRIISIYSEVPSMEERVFYPNFLSFTYNANENIMDIDEKIESKLKEEGLDVILVLKEIQDNIVEMCFQIRAKKGVRECVKRALKSVSIFEFQLKIDPLWNYVNRKYE